MRAAVLDACVLYPMGLRDTLLSVAQTRAFRPLWSAEIVDEMRRAVLRSVPESHAARIDRMLDVMQAAFPGAMVTGHLRMVPEMTNDQANRHVLAAAVHHGRLLSHAHRATSTTSGRRHP